MAVVEVSRENWFQRLGSAIKGVVIGLVLFVVSFPLLFWNEHRAVTTARRLEEGAAAVVATDPAAANAANDGKLIHFTGNAVPDGKLTDPKFNVTRDAIHLKRVAEMYQWKENKKEETKKDAVGGGETKKTTYTYEKVWSEKAIDSTDFKERGHGNPGSMPASSDHWDAAKVTVGTFVLSPELVGEIDNYTKVPLDAGVTSSLPDDVKDNAVVSDGVLYVRETSKPNPSSPEIGDVRVTFQNVEPGPVSVIGMQTPGSGGTGRAVTAWLSKNGPLQLLHVGTHSAAEMFAAEQSKNTMLTWLLRLVGFVVMWVGMMMALNPLKVVADVIGFVGDIAGIGIGLVTFVIAVSLTAVTIAIAWIAVRPVVGIGLLVVAAAAFALFIWLRKRGAAARRNNAGAAPATAASPVPAYATPGR